MELSQRNESKVVGAKRKLESFPILEDGFALVPFRETKIQNPFPGIKNAIAAWTCTETVYQPGEFLERSEFENLHSAHNTQ